MPIGNITNTDRAGATVVNAISDAAQRSGVSFDYLLAQAKLESGLDPQAKALTSSASGLFQFTKQSWLATLAKHGEVDGLGWAAKAIQQDGRGHYSVADPALRQQILDLRFDPHASSLMAAAFAEDNAGLLRERLGTEPEAVDLYLAHFLGGQGSARFLTALRADPDQAAAPLFPKAAAANRDIFYGAGGQPRTLHDIRERFRAKMEAAGATPNVPPRFAAGQTAHNRAGNHPEARARSADAAYRLPMQGFEPMPGKLSLAFAERTYSRLAAMGGQA